MHGNESPSDAPALPPSGEWRGFYVYSDNDVRHRQRMTLSFSVEAIRGGGIDGVGPFGIKGSYDPERREARWHKSYASHAVHYGGNFDGKSIWGIWTIGVWARGGFRIWPTVSGEADEMETEEAVDADEPMSIEYQQWISIRGLIHAVQGQSLQSRYSFFPVSPK